MFHSTWKVEICITLRYGYKAFCFCFLHHIWYARDMASYFKKTFRSYKYRNRADFNDSLLVFVDSETLNKALWTVCSVATDRLIQTANDLIADG